MRLLKYTLAFVLFVFGGKYFPQSSPDKVVEVNVKTPKVVYTNKESNIEVILQIKDGWHINSDKPLDDNLSPTVVSLNNNPEVKIVKISYPDPIITKLQFSQSQMALFEGEAVVKIQLMVNKGVKEKTIKLKGEVQYQPCNNQTCLFPTSKTFTIELKLKK